MVKRGVDELLGEISNLPPAERRRLVEELGIRVRSMGGGRKPLAKTAPAAVKMAKRLRRRGLSLRRIAGKLVEAGHLNERGQPDSAQSVHAMLHGPQKRKRSR